MAKTRVYMLARELNVESKVLIGKLKDLGIEVASHQSTLTDEQVALLKGGGAAVTEAKKTAAKPKVVVRRRRKAAVTEKPVVEAAPEISGEPTKGETVPVEEKKEEPVVVEPSLEKESTKEAAAEKVEEKSAVDEKIEEKPAKPKFKGGATIVRKATKEEIEARQSKRETSSSHDEGNVYRSGSKSSSGQQYWRTPASKTADPKGSSSGDEIRRPKMPPKNKRQHKSTKDLLGMLDEGEVPASPYRTPSRKRTVYTPNASQKRRDLKRRRDLKSTEVTMPRAAYRVVNMSDFITVAELAKQLSVKSGEVIKKLMEQGVMATLNQTVDVDVAALIASEYNYEVKNEVKTVETILDLSEVDNLPKEPRPPIVTVMGHVDHGKTSILDAIRGAGVATGEAGGITQHIGAYTVVKNGKTIAFLDTPGHASFSAMRSRGASITDIVILVVAADDGVMPQTIEAISHAKEAGVPIIVAINKMDKQGINLDRVYTELTEHGIQSEEWGGDTQFVKVSALQKTGLDDLLDAIQLQAELLELEASPTARAEGVVVESHLDKGKGPIATVIVTNGTLHKGDCLVAGQKTGRVRVMTDHTGKRRNEAGPSTPVQVVGLEDVPMAGDQVNAVSDEKRAKEVAELRAEQEHTLHAGKSSASSLEDLLNRVQSQDMLELPLIIKADTQGSVEAIYETVMKLNTDQIKNKVIHKSVGGINDSDISLAETSGSVILGFNVRAARGLDDKAEHKGVVINYFSIIYELVDAVKSLMSGKLPPIRTEVIQGHAEVRDAISVPKVGTVAGSAVTDGKITRHSSLRLIREEIVIFDGRIGSLRRFKDDVKEVQNGYECGISFDGYNDVKVGDVIEAYVIEETAATL